MGETTIWLAFAVSLCLIFVAGRKLSILGERLGEESGLGGTWIGVTVLSTVTSLPELITGLSAVAIAHTPEIAVGNALGACAFNVALLVLIHLVTWRQTPLFAQTEGRHVLPAAFGIVMLAMVAGEMLARQLGLEIAVFGIGPYVPMTIALYIIGIRVVFRSSSNETMLSRSEAIGGSELPALPGIQRRTLIGIAFVALVIIGSGTALPFIGAELAVQMGWNQSFVGTQLIAIATSAPEIAVTIAAARLGALDLAVGNVFGSIMFNIVVLALDDVFYRDGLLLADVSIAHAMTAITTMAMSGIAIAAMSYRRPAGPSVAILGMSAGLVLLYLGNAVIMFRLGH